MTLRFFFSALGLSTVLLGCGGSDSGGSDSGGSEIKTTASASCKEWQDALLTYIDRCSTSDADDVEGQTRAIHCASDEAALACVTQLEGAACSAAGVAGCDITDLADRAAAEVKCREFTDAYCRVAVECGAYASAEECSTEQGTALDCTQVIGWTHDFEACMSGLENLSCTASEPPAECEEVLIAAR